MLMVEFSPDFMALSIHRVEYMVLLRTWITFRAMIKKKYFEEGIPCVAQAGGYPIVAWVWSSFPHQLWAPKHASEWWAVDMNLLDTSSWFCHWVLYSCIVCLLVIPCMTPNLHQLYIKHDGFWFHEKCL